jgi:hypothetical protein
MKYRRTGAWWFLKRLWDYYCPHLERPESTGSSYFLIGLSVVPEERLLPALRSIWARHLRSQRLDSAKVEIASLWRYRMSTGSGDPLWRHCLWPRLCKVRRFVFRAKPRLTQADVLSTVASFGS